MKEVILVKLGELALKGLNRSTFEAALVKRLRRSLEPLGGVTIDKAQSTLTLTPLEESFDFEAALARVGRAFGVAAYSRALAVEKKMDVLLAAAPAYLKQALADQKTFKVEARRSDKRFPYRSPELCAQLGECLLRAFPHLRVDVHNPDVVVNVEVRDRAAYLHCGQFTGAGGLPCGTAGRAAVLISGGIDSPVAAYMMAKRGVELNAIHFASPPYTSPRAVEKVRHLLSRVACYSGPIRLGIVPFTEIQQKIADTCPEAYFTLVMRRMMMRIAQRLAEQRQCGALITGESLGQVASQTLAALAATDAVVSLPVFRPLIGMDKEEIIRISRKIDTFSLSIEPYEDCCTVFTPKHPRTRPTLEQCAAAEAPLDVEALAARAAAGTAFELIL